jgi:N-sulfoglucosamine sulfohydrolase
MLSSALLFILVAQKASTAPPGGQKNVLLMNVDDGGFQIGVYGNKAAKTPNIDNFAERAVTFKHGFTSVSSCSPSRSALLTGMCVILF